MTKKRSPKSRNTQSRLSRNVSIAVVVIVLAWIANAVLPKSSSDDTRFFVLTIIGTILGGVVILLIEYTYFQTTERRSRGSIIKNKRNSFYEFIRFLIENKSKAVGGVVAPSWNRAQQIALDELKAKLEKYDWEKTDVSIVKFRSERNLAYLVAEIHDTTYARPLNIESYILVISKLGDLQSLDPYNMSLAKQFKLM